MTGVALLILFVVFIPVMGAAAAALTSVWPTAIANQTPAHTPHARCAFHPYSFKFISDRTSGFVVALYQGFLPTGLWNRTSESKFDNLLMSDLRIRVMLSPKSSQKTLSHN